MQLEIGRTVDRYVIEGVLGQGGLAEVYRVRHTLLGTPHALKVLLLPSPKIRARLLQEGAIQANLRHPNIVSVTDVVDVDGAPGLVMELVDGPSLDHRLESGPLSIAELELYGRGILAGVAAAHALGMIHRDLKPANVLLSPTGKGFIAKVTDFGLAKILNAEPSDTHTRTGATLGTPLYMAPEQIVDAKNVDIRADVFSLGAVLYEMATGRRAFEGTDVADTMVRVRDVQFTPVRELRPDLPEKLAAVITAALVRSPDRRVADAGEMLQAWVGKKGARKEQSPSPKQDQGATWDEAPAPPRRKPTPPTVVMEPLQPVESLASLPSVDGEPLGQSVTVPAPPPPPDPVIDARIPLWMLVAPIGMFGVLALSLLGVMALPTRGRPPEPGHAADPAEAAVDEPAPAAEPVKVARPDPPRVTGTLRLRSRPNAEIKLDGRPAGDTAAFERTMPAGPHKVILASHNSTETTQLTVIVPPNEAVEICWDFATRRFCE